MTTNLFADLPRQLPDELFTTLLEAANVRIERIVSHGHASPEGFWFAQDQHEWVIVLRGAARLRFEDIEQPMLQWTDYVVPILENRRPANTSWKLEATLSARLVRASVSHSVAANNVASDCDQRQTCTSSQAFLAASR